jgi:hypothetical protein
MFVEQPHTKPHFLLQILLIHRQYPQKNNCEAKAKELISKCDWSVLPDVNLQNKSDFENYRSILRNLILNPIEDPIFPIEPTPIWSN